MAGPTDVVVDGNDRLWVADANNNRVLRFDNITTKPNGAAADGVLGQTTLNTGGGVGPSGLSQSKMDTPFALAVSSGGSLYVSDRDNHRVFRSPRMIRYGWQIATMPVRCVSIMHPPKEMELRQMEF
jgi:DNA-binding beta-propeller fold protein YncE